MLHNKRYEMKNQAGWPSLLNPSCQLIRCQLSLDRTDHDCTRGSLDRHDNQQTASEVELRPWQREMGNPIDSVTGRENSRVRYDERRTATDDCCAERQYIVAYA